MIPEEWDLSGKRALITADRRGWTPHLAAALAEWRPDDGPMFALLPMDSGADQDMIGGVR